MLSLESQRVLTHLFYKITKLEAQKFMKQNSLFPSGPVMKCQLF